MHQTPPSEKIGITIGHIDDVASMDAVCATLAALHGESYRFSVVRWQGHTELTAQPGRSRVCFVMHADQARSHLAPGQRVRGVPSDGPYQPLDEEHWAAVTAATAAEIWPGDVLCIDQPVTVSGQATCLQIET